MTLLECQGIAQARDRGHDRASRLVVRSAVHGRLDERPAGTMAFGQMTKRAWGSRTRAADHAVLDAAAGLFRRKGFAATTVREIAASAGMLPGSLHYRYASKEQLLLELMGRAVQRGEDAIGQAIEGIEDPLERVRAALTAHLRLLVSDDDSIYVLLYDWRTLAGEARQAMVALRDRYEQVWAGLLDEAARSGRFRRGLDLRLARLLGFGAVNWVAQWYSPSGPNSAEQIADFCWEVLCFGVLTNDQAPREARHHSRHRRAGVHAWRSPGPSTT